MSFDSIRGYIQVASGITDVEETALPKGSEFFPKPYATNQITKSLREIAREMASRRQ